MASTHTISVTGTQSNVGWYLYAASDFQSNRVASCNTSPGAGAGDESCVTPPLTPDAPYYLLVAEWDNVAGTYSVLVNVP